MFIFIWFAKRLEKVSNPAAAEEYLLRMEKKHNLQKPPEPKTPPPKLK